MRGVDPDHLRGELEGEGAHEADDAVLGGAVVGDVRECRQPGRRARQHDRASAPVGPQVRDGPLRGGPDAGEIGVDHVAPFLLGQLVGGAETRDARVGAHDAEPAELSDAVVVDRDDVGTLLGPAKGMAAALPSCRTDNECDLAFHAVHVGPPCRERTICRGPRRSGAGEAAPASPDAHHLVSRRQRVSERGPRT